MSILQKQKGNQYLKAFLANGLLAVLVFLPFIIVGKGDINKDGTVNEQDVAYFERYLAGWTGYSRPDASVGDLNGDGNVDVADYNLLVKQVG